MNTSSSITSDVLNLVQIIESKAIHEFQTACSEVVISLNLRDQIGRVISPNKLCKMIGENKKINTFLFDDISKQAIAIFTIITQGTPRVLYTNLNCRKKFSYQVQIIQSILIEEFGKFEDINDQSTLLVQMSMESKRKSNPLLQIKNVSYTSAVTLAVMSMNAITTVFDPLFVKILFGYLFFFPLFPFITFFAPWPVLLVFPFCSFLYIVGYKTLNQLVIDDED